MITIKTSIRIYWIHSNTTVYEDVLDFQGVTSLLEKQIIEVVLAISDLQDTCPLEFGVYINKEKYYLYTTEESDPNRLEWHLTKHVD